MSYMCVSHKLCDTHLCVHNSCDTYEHVCVLDKSRDTYMCVLGKLCDTYEWTSRVTYMCVTQVVWHMCVC